MWSGLCAAVHTGLPFRFLDRAFVINRAVQKTAGDSTARYCTPVQSTAVQVCVRAVRNVAQSYLLRSKNRGEVRGVVATAAVRTSWVRALLTWFDHQSSC